MTLSYPSTRLKLVDILSSLAGTDGLISSLRKHRNSLAALHHLPREILLDIFSLAVHLERRTNLPRNFAGSAYYNGLLDVRLTCTFWNECIVEAPVFWSIVDLSAPGRQISQCLDRSRGAVLSVTANLPWKGSASGTADLDSRFLQVCLQMHRVRHLNVNCGEGFGNQLLSCRAPSLEYLNILDPSNSHTELLHGPLFDLDAPRVHSLRILGNVIPSGLPGLRSLSLAYHHCKFAKVDSFLEQIASVPQLEHLRLERCKHSQVNAPTPATQSPEIRMLCLRELDLFNMWRQGSSNILQALIAPNILVVRVDGLSRESFLDRLLSKFFPNPITTSPASSTVSITSLGKGFAVKVWGRELLFGSRSNGSTGDETLRQILGFFRGQDAHLILDSTSSLSLRQVDTIDSCNLTQLTYRLEPRASVADLAMHLSRKPKKKCGSRWAFSNIRDLVLDSSTPWSVSDIIDMITGHSSASQDLPREDICTSTIQNLKILLPAHLHSTAMGLKDEQRLKDLGVIVAIGLSHQAIANTGHDSEPICLDQDEEASGEAHGWYYDDGAFYGDDLGE